MRRLGCLLLISLLIFAATAGADDLPAPLTARVLTIIILSVFKTPTLPTSFDAGNFFAKSGFVKQSITFFEGFFETKEKVTVFI